MYTLCMYTYVYDHMYAYGRMYVCVSAYTCKYIKIVKRTSRQKYIQSTAVLDEIDNLANKNNWRGEFNNKK